MIWQFCDFGCTFIRSIPIYGTSGIIVLWAAFGHRKGFAMSRSLPSPHSWVAGMLLFLGTASAEVTVPPASSGTVQRITDMATRDHRVVNFRVSRDLSTAILLVSELAEDPRGCGGEGAVSGFRQSLWKLDLETGQFALVEQGYTYDTGVGNFCATSIIPVFDISDDGGTIVYARLGQADRLPDLMVNRNGSSNILLEELPQTSWGELNYPNVDPSYTIEGFEISGDGDWLYFINSFGPQGADTGINPDGRTIYRVSTNSSAAAKILSNADLAGLGLNPVPVEVSGSSGRLAAPYDGSFVLSAVGGSFPSANRFTHLLKLTPAAEPQIVLTRPAESEVTFIGPSITPDGQRIAFVWTPWTAQPEGAGVFLYDLESANPPMLIDPGLPFRQPGSIHLSSDGSSTIQFYDLAGRYLHRMSYAAENIIDIATYPMIQVAWGHQAWLGASGDQAVFLGNIRHDGIDTDYSFEDLHLLDRSAKRSTVAAPAVGGMTAAPRAVMVKDPTLAGLLIHHHEFTASDPDLGAVYTVSINRSDGSPQEGGGAPGTSSDYGLLDDGAWDGVDEAAGDGIFTEGGIWVRDSFMGDVVTYRFAATTEDSASYLDFDIPVLPTTDFYQQRFVSGREDFEETFDNTGVMMHFNTNSSNMSVLVQHIPGVPFELPGGLSEHWLITQLNPSTFQAILQFTYNDGNLRASESDLLLYRSETGTAPWALVPAVVDPENNTVTTEGAQSSFSFWAIAAQQKDWFIVR